MKYILDVHCHTISSGHAYSTITENIMHAKKIGLELIAITDHTPMMPGAPCNLHFLNLHVLPNNIDGVELLKGAELNILNEKGEIDLPDAILQNLDIKIASLHPPCIAPTDDIKINTNAVLNAMENKFIDIIGHLGDPRYPIDVKKVVKQSIQTNTLIELNNSSLNPNNSRAGGEETIISILEECKAQKAPIILGSDAHYFTDVGNFKDAIRLLKKANFPDELIINTDVLKLKNFLKMKKA